MPCWIINAKENASTALREGKQYILLTFRPYEPFHHLAFSRGGGYIHTRTTPVLLPPSISICQRSWSLYHTRLLKTKLLTNTDGIAEIFRHPLRIQFLDQVKINSRSMPLSSYPSSSSSLRHVTLVRASSFRAKRTTLGLTYQSRRYYFWALTYLNIVWSITARIPL